MWSTTALLVLLVGACAASPIHADDASDGVVQKFLARMTRSIESKDVSIISGLFQPAFVFKGCKGVYDKKKIVGLLSNVPAGAKFSVNLKSSEDLGKSIKYLVSIGGFDKDEIVAEFVLNKVDQQLESGNVPACQKSPRHFANAQDDAQTVVEKFVARIVRSIQSKDTAVISGLFQPGFIFKGCKGTYDKTKIVGLLSQFPAGSKFDITVKSVQDLGASIKYQVSAKGFDKNEIVAEFVLNKADQQLESGNVPACQKNLHSRVARDTAQVTVEKFVARIVRSVESKDVSIISGLFQPGFVFKGCKGTYDKTKIVGLLSQFPAGSKFDITVKSVQDLGASIKYQVSAKGFDKNEIIAEFVLNKNDQQLESGNVPACAASHAASRRQANYAQGLIHNYLLKLKRAVRDHDRYEISKLFDKDFVIRGCKRTYNKNEVVDELNKVDSVKPFGYELHSVAWAEHNNIEFSATISGVFDGFKADFVWTPGDVVVFARYTSCLVP